EFELGWTPLASNAIQNLQVLRPARGGAQQPIAPGLGFVSIAGGQQGVQSERGVAQPAISIVPVAHAAHLFGQRGGWRRNYPARWRVTQSFECQQRAVYRVLPLTSVGSLRGPFAPPTLCLPALSQPIEMGRRLFERRE